MRYWLFDGEDVIGPFTPQEITARAGFSDSILVCPETKSEDENAWQIAANFEDFTPKKRLANKEKSKKESAKNTKDPLPKATAKVPLAVTSVPISHVEGEENVLPIETTGNDAQEPPAATVTKEAAAAQAPTASPAAPNKTPQTQVPGQDTPAPSQNANASEPAAPTTKKEATPPLSKNKTDPGLWPELSLHSLPILGVSENTLPPLPVGDITFYIPGKEPAIWNQPQDTPLPQATAPQKATPQQPAASAENSPVDKRAPLPQKQTPGETAAAKSNAPAQGSAPAKDNPVKKAPPALKKPSQKAPTAKFKRPPIPAPLPAAIPEDAPEDFFAQTFSSFSQVPKELVQAQAQEAIAHLLENSVPSPQEPDDFIPQKPSVSGSRFLLFIGFFLFIILLLILGGYWLARAHRTHAGRNTAGTLTLPASTTVALPEISVKPSAKDTRPDISVPPPAVSVSPLQEKALDIVKNYTLSRSRGTVEEYFNKLYALQLSQGYKASWSAEPLHRNSYIVKYRLTKTRTEPIVYVFQVDVSTERLTGALNNITLDLVGKI